MTDRRQFLKQSFAAGSALLLQIQNLPANSWSSPNYELNQIFQELDNQLKKNAIRKEVPQGLRTLSSVQYYGFINDFSLCVYYPYRPEPDCIGIPEVFYIGVDKWISNEDEKYILQKFYRKYDLETFPSNRMYKEFNPSHFLVKNLYDWVINEQKGENRKVCLANIVNRRVVQVANIVPSYFTDRKYYVISELIGELASSSMRMKLKPEKFYIQVI